MRFSACAALRGFEARVDGFARVCAVMSCVLGFSTGMWRSTSATLTTRRWSVVSWRLRTRRSSAPSWTACEQQRR